MTNTQHSGHPAGRLRLVRETPTFHLMGRLLLDNPPRELADMKGSSTYIDIPHLSFGQVKVGAGGRIHQALDMRAADDGMTHTLTQQHPRELLIHALAELLGSPEAFPAMTPELIAFARLIAIDPSNMDAKRIEQMLLEIL